VLTGAGSCWQIDFMAKFIQVRVYSRATRKIKQIIKRTRRTITAEVERAIMQYRCNGK